MSLGINTDNHINLFNGRDVLLKQTCVLCVTFAFSAVILPLSSQWITQRAQKKQTKYLHLIKKTFIPLSYITKNIRPWK